jgi:AcrR family transcriptional regulator
MSAEGGAGVTEQRGETGKGLWRQTPRPQREEQMLEAAMKLFADGGYSNVSMDAIAAETGITKPLLYSYFGSKEGLYVACIERFFVPLDGAIVGAGGGGGGLPPERWLWEGALAAFRFIGDNRDEWMRFLIEAPAHGERAAAAIDAVREQVVGQVAGMFEQAIRDSALADVRAEIPSQVRIFVGGVESLARWWVAHPDEATAEVLAMRLLNQSWMGFGDLLEGRVWLPPADWLHGTA